MQTAIFIKTTASYDPKNGFAVVFKSNSTPDSIHIAKDFESQEDDGLIGEGSSKRAIYVSPLVWCWSICHSHNHRHSSTARNMQSRSHSIAAQPTLMWRARSMLNLAFSVLLTTWKVNSMSMPKPAMSPQSQVRFYHVWGFCDWQNILLCRILF